MNKDEIVKVFDQIVTTVSSSDELQSCRRDVLDITGQRGNEVLLSVDVQSDLDHVISQVRKILDSEPIFIRNSTPLVRFIPRIVRGQEYAGHYLAGWSFPDGHHQRVSSAMKISSELFT